MKIPFLKSDDDPGATPSPAAADAGPAKAKAKFGRLVIPTLLLLVVAATIGVFAYAANEANADARIFAGLDAQQRFSQSVSKETTEAMQGSERAFRELEKSADQFDATLASPAVGDPLVPVRPLPAHTGLSQALDLVAQAWVPVRADVDLMLAERPAVVSALASADEFSELSRNWLLLRKHSRRNLPIASQPIAKC